MKVLIMIFFLLLVGLQYKLWFSQDGISTVQRLKTAITTKTLENLKLNDRNAALSAEIKDLKHGYHAIEEHARNDLGMVRQDETLYKIVPAEQSEGSH